MRHTTNAVLQILFKISLYTTITMSYIFFYSRNWHKLLICAMDVFNVFSKIIFIEIYFL